jgi:hypothetical protein
MLPYTSLTLKNSSVNFLNELFEEVDTANIQDAQELQKLLNFNIQELLYLIQQQAEGERFELSEAINLKRLAIARTRPLCDPSIDCHMNCM